jgi:hypothetical protein
MICYITFAGWPYHHKHIARHWVLKMGTVLLAHSCLCIPLLWTDRKYYADTSLIIVHMCGSRGMIVLQIHGC